MSKMADFVMDFLATAGGYEEYDKHNWDWDNLPPLEKMWEIVEKHREETK